MTSVVDTDVKFIHSLVCIAWCALIYKLYRNPNGLFTIEYQPDGRIAMRASNGRYITAKMNGSLYATSDAPTEKELFCMIIVNRPLLVLRCEYGFVGMKSPSNPRYECNKTVYDVLFTEGVGSVYSLKGKTP